MQKYRKDTGEIDELRNYLAHATTMEELYRKLLVEWLLEARFWVAGIDEAEDFLARVRDAVRPDDNDG